MEHRNRSLQEGSELLPEAMKTRLRGIHALAVEAAMTIDPMMLAAFDAEHEGSVAPG